MDSIALSVGDELMVTYEAVLWQNNEVLSQRAWTFWNYGDKLTVFQEPDDEIVRVSHKAEGYPLAISPVPLRLAISMRQAWLQKGGE